MTSTAHLPIALRLLPLVASLLVSGCAARLSPTLHRLAPSSAAAPSAIAAPEPVATTVAEALSERTALLALADAEVARPSGDPGALDGVLRQLGAALARDDRDLPVLDRLARVHLARAERTPRGRRRRPDAAALELAARGCARAAQLDPDYAPAHLTAGLVALAGGDPTRAGRELEAAVRLDPSLIEAHRALGALRLRHYAFPEAAASFRAVLRLAPQDYDAELGLGLALRGQLRDDDAFDPTRSAAIAAVERAERIAPERPEAFLDHGALVLYFVETSPAGAEAALLQARGLFAMAVARAGDAPVFANTRRRAAAYLAEIDDLTVCIVRDERSRKLQEAELRQQRAEDDARAPADEAP